MPQVWGWLSGHMEDLFKKKTKQTQAFLNEDA